MFTIADESEKNWCWPDMDDESMICCEDGTTKPLTMDDVLCTRGKFDGYKLSEISDTGYLKWLLNTMTDDHFIQLVCKIRLEQLS